MRKLFFNYLVRETNCNKNIFNFYEITAQEKFRLLFCPQQFVFILTSTLSEGTRKSFLVRVKVLGTFTAKTFKKSPTMTETLKISILTNSWNNNSGHNQYTVSTKIEFLRKFKKIVVAANLQKLSLQQIYKNCRCSKFWTRKVASFKI